MNIFIPWLLDKTFFEAIEHPDTGTSVLMWIIFGALLIYTIAHSNESSRKSEEKRKKEIEEKQRNDKYFPREEGKRFGDKDGNDYIV